MFRSFVQTFTKLNDRRIRSFNRFSGDPSGSSNSSCMNALLSIVIHSSVFDICIYFHFYLLTSRGGHGPWADMAWRLFVTDWRVWRRASVNGSKGVLYARKVDQNGRLSVRKRRKSIPPAYYTPKNRPPGVRTPDSKSLTEALVWRDIKTFLRELTEELILGKILW